MKKIIASIFSIMFLSANIVLADGDLWDNYGDQNSYGQKPVTDKEFDEALEMRTKHKNKNKIPKGTEFHQSQESDFLKDAKEELPVLCIPMDLKLSNTASLPIGHYQVMGVKKDDKIFLRLYQAHNLIAEIPATETTNDFNQDSVTFVKLLDPENNQIEIIFGSIDFNAHSIIDIAE